MIYKSFNFSEGIKPESTISYSKQGTVMLMFLEASCIYNIYMSGLQITKISLSYFSMPEKLIICVYTILLIQMATPCFPYYY